MRTVAANTKYWPIQSTGQYKVLANTKYRPIQSTGQYKVLANTKYLHANTKYRPIQSTGQYKVPANTKYRPIQSTGQYKVPANTKYRPIQSTGQYKVLANTKYWRMQCIGPYVKYCPMFSHRILLIVFKFHAVAMLSYEVASFLLYFGLILFYYIFSFMRYLSSYFYSLFSIPSFFFIH